MDKFRKFLIQKNLGPENFLSPTKNGSKTILGPQNFSSTKMLGPKSFGLKSCCVQNIWVKQNFGAKIKALKKLGQKSLVKIGSVTAKILLIWTNVTKKVMV